MTSDEKKSVTQRQARSAFAGPDRRGAPRVSRLQFTHFFCTFMVCITFYLLLDDIFLQYSMTYHTSEIFTFVLLSLMCVFFIVQIWRDRLPLFIFGFTLRDWRFAIWDSVKWTMIVLLVITLGKAGLLWLTHHWSWKNLIDVKSLFTKQHYMVDWQLQLLYFAGIPLQEIIARGMVQTYFTSVFVGRYYAWAGNMVATCYFAILHSHVSLELPIFVIGLSLFWGWLFMRQRSLLGCTLSHVIISFWGYYVIMVQHMNLFMY